MAISTEIEQKASDIRTKINGKDVREALASGLEVMSNEIDTYETTMSGNWDDVEQVEQGRVIAEQTRQTNETTRQTNETNRQTAETTRVNEFNTIKTAYDAATHENTSVELTAARASGVTGQTYNNIGLRMDNTDSQLAEKAKQSDLNTTNNNITALTTNLATTNQNVASNTSAITLKADKIYVDNKIGNIGNTKTFKGSCTFANLPTTGNTNGDYYYVTDKTTNYCWNGTAFVDIGNNINVGDGTITKSKLESKMNDVFENSYTSIPITWNSGGYYSHTSKQIQSDANTNYSNPISVNSGEEYLISGSYYYVAKPYVILDSSGNVVGYYPSDDSSTGKVNNYSFVIPQNGVSLILNKYIGSDTNIINQTILYKATKYLVKELAMECVSASNLSSDFDNVFINKYESITPVWNNGGYYNYSTGKAVTQTGFNYANPINVSEGEKYQISGTAIYAANLYTVIDANGNILTSYPNSYLNTLQTYNDLIFTIPVGGAQLLINESTSVNTILSKASSITLSNSLTGKKIDYNGDSICAGDGNNEVSYPEIIAKNNGGTFEKRAIGGGTLASGTGKSRMVCTDITNMASDADIICFEGGINDYWNNVPLGALTIGDGTSSASMYTDTIDTTTFAGALESIFRQSIAKWSGKPICFIIVHKIKNTIQKPNTLGKNFTDYVNMIIAACNKYSIPYCDLFHNSGMVCDIPSIATTYTVDGTHPNDAGYRAYYIPQITALLKSLV